MVDFVDWTKFEVIPAGEKTQSKMMNYLVGIKRTIRGGVRGEIVSRCVGKTVLDIGSLEHGWDNISKQDGMFFRIHKVAKHVTGLDIIEKDCAKMRDNGFDFVCVDATSKEYLGRKFDVVNVGDVIEHVDSPVALLDFCKRHLNPGGEILVTTPNPYYASTLINLFRFDEQITNFQHTSWIVPCMGLEIGRRVGLEMKELVISEPSTEWKRIVLFWMPQVFKSGVYLFVYKVA